MKKIWKTGAELLVSIKAYFKKQRTQRERSRYALRDSSSSNLHYIERGGKLYAFDKWGNGREV